MERFEQRARAQCRIDLLPVGLSEEGLVQAVDHYWPAVATEFAGGIEVPGVRFPPDIAKLVEDYLALRRREDRLFPKKERHSARAEGGAQ